MRAMVSIIAQILLIWLILPIVVILFGEDVLLDFIQGIPIFDTWVGVLNDYFTLSTSSLLWIYANSFLQAIIMGFCIYIAQGIGDIVLPGMLHILSTFLGILVGVVLIKLLGLTHGFQLVIYLVIIIGAIIMMLKGVLIRFKVFSMKLVLMIVIESILAVILCGYIVALLLFKQGSLGIDRVFILLIISIAALFITYWVGYLVKKDVNGGVRGLPR